MATFLTVVLCLVGTWGAAGPEDALLLEADFGEIGWLCIKTFFNGGEPLPKRTTGAAGRNVKGEPSACVGVGPSCCCKETEQNYKNHCKPLQRNLQPLQGNASGSTCSAGTSYSASSCFSNGPRAFLKTWVFHIDHQVSKPSVDEVKERLVGIGMARASKKE